MSSLESLVRLVVDEFMNDGVLFTALDVSNRVKETMPIARHKDARNEVRNLWSQSVMDNASYGRTPIQVFLPDGSMADALLYHPLSDSWDLDTKYDAQKRTQTSSVQTITTPIAAPVNIPVVNVPAVVSTPVQVSAPILVQTSAIDAWNNLFNTQPSLFPRKQ